MCASLQGRMYSIFGKDTRFPPLSTAFKNGYRNVHPECRHHVSAWIEEFQTPEELQQAIDTSWQPFEDPRPEEDKALYNKQQKQNRQMRQDRYQHERYKARLGEDVPKTFSTFRRMKKAGGEHWVNLTAMYKHIGSLPPAMDATRYGKMVMIALKKQGVQVIHVKGDDAAFLRALNAEAMLMGNTHILHLQKVPSASAFFEEIIVGLSMICYTEV
ncbi:MAG: phage minor capsid protein [Eubacteriales bacterium]